VANVIQQRPPRGHKHAITSRRQGNKLVKRNEQNDEYTRYSSNRVSVINDLYDDLYYRAGFVVEILRELPVNLAELSM